MKLLKHARTALLDRLPNGRKLNHRFPHEQTNLQLAKLVRRERMGNYTLGHYQSNPPQPPDYITTQVCRFHSAAEGDLECLSWTVTPVTPEQLSKWPDRPSRHAPCGHLLALSDDAGNIILFDFLERAEAERAMDAACGTAAVPAAGAELGEGQ